MVRVEEEKFVENYNLAGKLLGMSALVIGAMVASYYIGRAIEGRDRELIAPVYEMPFVRSVLSPDGEHALRIKPDASSTRNDEFGRYAIWSRAKSMEVIDLPKLDVFSGRHPGETDVLWEGTDKVHILVPDGSLASVEAIPPMKRAGILVHFYKGHPAVLAAYREKLLERIHSGANE